MIRFPPMSRVLVLRAGKWDPGQVREASGSERLVQTDEGDWKWANLKELKPAGGKLSARAKTRRIIGAVLTLLIVAAYAAGWRELTFLGIVAVVLAIIAESFRDD